ncbi:MAG: IPTL-CTERM sorting domain-containing protein [Phycisphaerales bacterium]|nr:MAG: IPTL-CTERM sorting domain-containing protein [Phycisphaerales bacterium]
MRRAALSVLAVVGATIFAMSAEGQPSGMVLIPGGEFLMGDHFNEGGLDELPLHAVYVDSFYMDVYEVTNQQYADALNWALGEGDLIYVGPDNLVYGPDQTTPYCDTTSSSPYTRLTWDGGTETFGVTTGKENHPILKVTWYGAAAYANWRSTQDGRTPSYNLSTWECDFDANGYRLPTEAEWEYAARGGEHDPYYRYPWGDTIDGSNANYWNSGDPFGGTFPPEPETTPVGYYDGGQVPKGSDMANGYRLYDMAGNVYEWCNDWYASDYYITSRYDNPHGPVDGDSRVLRSGSWGNIEDFLRCASRLHGVPDDGNGEFRLVLPASDIPTLSGYALVGMTLLVLAAGTVVLRRRRGVACT